MRSRLPSFCSVAGCCALLLFASLLSAPAQLSTPYEEPDLTIPAFDTNRLSLDAPVRNRLASVLAAGVTDYNSVLDAKILGIALRLDPGNRAALDTSARRKRGELPQTGKGNPAYPPATIANYLACLSAGLRTKGGPDNLALAGFLNEIAVEIDPDNPVAAYEKASYATANPPANWSFLKSKGPPEAKPLSLVKSQSRIRGLGVRELADGERSGAVMEMIITAEVPRSQREVGITVEQSVGATMLASLQEAGRAVRLRHPGFGAGQHLALSFTDRIYKDGPSGATAFTLLLYSLYDTVRLAADCAITGGVSVDGRIHAVGAVPSKIQAALAGGCRIVAIPQENADAVSDVTLLYPANTLWKLQIFTVDNVDQALAVMREDRSADLRQAIDLFAAVQRKVGLETPRLSSVNLDIVPQLREVLRLAPCHASAAAMLKLLEGRGASTLSLYASLDEVDRITLATLRAAKPTPARRTVDQQAVSVGVGLLQTLRPRLDFRVSDLCSASLAGLQELQKMSSSKPSDEEFAAFDKRVQAIKEVEGRMSADLGIVEALRH